MSPVQPSELDTAIQFSLSPITPTRFPTGISYFFGFSIANPSNGTTVRLVDLMFTIYGPNGSVYGTVTNTLNRDLPPGVSEGGATGSYTDQNLSRPPATRYTGRLTYTRADGSRLVLDRESTYPPPR